MTPRPRRPCDRRGRHSRCRPLYEQRAQGLGTEFLRALDVSFAEITPMPERFAAVHRECRRALLRRFPYAVYFVATPDRISVVACMHARRDPRRWEERVGA
jgi:plasmid stabilization system protein ParE